MGFPLRSWAVRALYVNSRDSNVASWFTYGPYWSLDEATRVYNNLKTTPRPAFGRPADLSLWTHRVFRQPEKLRDLTDDLRNETTYGSGSYFID